MAANFRIAVRRKGKDVDLNLIGDFDGSSALELLHFLKENCVGCEKVVIQTHGLRQIYPFGRDVFQSNLCLLNGQSIRFLFQGENANKIAPGMSKWFGGL